MFVDGVGGPDYVNKNGALSVPLFRIQKILSNPCHFSGLKKIQAFRATIQQ